MSVAKDQTDSRVLEVNECRITSKTDSQKIMEMKLYIHYKNVLMSELEYLINSENRLFQWE